MNKGEWLTRVTIWITLGGYFTGEAARLVSRGRPRWESLARWAWTAGALSLLVHVAFAFHFYHAWSHEAAWRETARQTMAVTGMDWGGGLFINYVLMAAWLADAAWWWRGFEAYRRRPKLWTTVWHGFLLFIVFNATVVFKAGWLRWIGLALCVALVLLWWNSRSDRQGMNS
jgi:hypothetical protein